MRNEYQDQEMWYRVEGNYGGVAGWEMLADEDTREEAEAVQSACEQHNPGIRYRVRRMYGLA